MELRLLIKFSSDRCPF